MSFNLLNEANERRMLERVVGNLRKYGALY
jgi:hypothetical protein